jgi:hypothetical protein
MASSGAVVYLKSYGVGGGALARSSGAVVYLPHREVSGVYQVGVGTAQTRPNDVAWLPSAQTPIANLNGRGQYVMEPSWYRFFQHVADVRLGGRAAPSLPDVVTTVETTQAAAVQSGQQVSALTQQSQANAEALSVVVQVAQNNSLTGADQIPPVILNPYENIP